MYDTAAQKGRINTLHYPRGKRSFLYIVSPTGWTQEIESICPSSFIYESPLLQLNTQTTNDSWGEVADNAAQWANLTYFKLLRFPMGNFCSELTTGSVHTMLKSSYIHVDLFFFKWQLFSSKPSKILKLESHDKI